MPLSGIFLLCLVYKYLSMSIFIYSRGWDGKGVKKTKEREEFKIFADLAHA